MELAEKAMLKSGCIGGGLPHGDSCSGIIRSNQQANGGESAWTLELWRDTELQDNID
jgi:hypothetical protein